MGVQLGSKRMNQGSPRDGRYATNRDCRIYYETFGDSARPTLLLVNGLGSQCINYHSDWCALFADSGFHVVRYDNRDMGLSTHFSSWTPASPPVPGDGPYLIGDMAADAIAVLDDLGVERAHVMGLSMGGVIVQYLLMDHRDRLLSAVAVMTRTGEPGLGGGSPEAQALLTAAPATDLESAIERHIAGLRVWGSPACADEDRWRIDATAAFERCFDPDGETRQWYAIQATIHLGRPVADDLARVTTPLLVMHGTADTLIDISGGRRLTELVPDAEFVAIDGLGHDYPPQLWPVWTDHVAEFCLAHPG